MTIKIEKSGGKARFIENDQEFLVADEGNVGIGTDNPAAKLDVAGVIQGGTSNATNGQTILTGNYVGDNKLNTIGSNRTEGGTVIGYAVKPKEGANLDDFVSSAGNASFHRSAYTAGITHRWFTQGSSSAVPVDSDVNMTERMRITTDGNVGIGTTTPFAKLDVAGDVKVTDTLTIGANDPDTGTGASLTLGTLFDERLTEVASLREGGSFSSAITFSTNDGQAGTLAERARIIGAGYFKVDPSGSYTDNAGNEKLGTVHFIKHNGANGEGLILAKTDATNSSPTLVLSQANNTNGFIIQAKTGTGLLDENVFLVAADGDVVNQNNSYGAISDIKLKENITDSTPKLDDIAAIRFVNYNLKSQPDTKQFGVIAQELEEIFPALVETTPDVDDEGNETGESTKSVKYSVLTLMAVKALQEANDKITALEERLAALEAGN